MNTRMLTISVSFAKSATRRASLARVIRTAYAWMIAAPPTHVAAATTCRDLKNVYHVMPQFLLRDLEELLELHRGAHVSFDLELPGHIGARSVLLAADEPGRGAEVTRHVLLSHHHRHAERPDDARSDQRERDRARHAADQDEHERQRTGREDARQQDRPRPEAIRQRAERKGPDAAG